jgi:cell division septum initiation protein DivIVA
MNTEVALLKKEVSDIKFIFNRLDTAIEKITEVTTSVNRMLAVHEEKLSQQEEASNRANKEFSDDIKELHSRITTNSKEMRDMITKYQIEQTAHIENLRSDLNGRVGVLEKWRWLIIGGSIVIGFAIQEIPIWG